MKQYILNIEGIPGSGKTTVSAQVRCALQSAVSILRNSAAWRRVVPKGCVFVSSTPFGQE